LDLDDLLATARALGAAVSLQAMRRTLPREVGIPAEQSAIYVTGCVPQPVPVGAPELLAGRIPLERIEIWPPHHAAAIRARSTERANQALALVQAAAATAGVPVATQAGILAAPGVLEDLLSIRTTCALWRYEVPNPDDSTTWQIVPTAAPEGGQA
jgi:hypothetical protein